ncbi:MAG: flagellar basal body rod protein FlgF [Pseudomonadota bacterium]
MDRFLYLAMTGAQHNMRAQDIHTNNLANVTTDGFRAEFAQARSMPVQGDGYPSRVYALTEKPGVDFSAGSRDFTDNELDLAIRQEGWFTVLDEQGEEAFTRAGSFFVDVNGFMRTQSGQILMGNAGPMVVPPYEKIEVGVDGTVSIRALGQGPETLVEVDRMKLVNPLNEDLEKGGDGLFRRIDGEFEPPSAKVLLDNGVVEKSNVNPVTSLIEFMTLSRQFELQVKMMNKAEELDQSSAQLLQQ